MICECMIPPCCRLASPTNNEITRIMLDHLHSSEQTHSPFDERHFGPKQKPPVAAPMTISMAIPAHPGWHPPGWGSSSSSVLEFRAGGVVARFIGVGPSGSGLAVRHKSARGGQKSGKNLSWAERMLSPERMRRRLRNWSASGE